MINKPKKSVLSIVGLLSGIAGFTTILGVLTSKIISLYAGPEGIAALGLFRSLAASVSATLSLGYFAVFMQQSTGKPNAKQIFSLFSAACVLLITQFVIIVVGFLFFYSPFLSVFSKQASLTNESFSYQIVAIMAVGAVGVQILYSIFRGLGDIRTLTTIQLIVSVGNLIFIYPLLKFGKIGIAISVGASSLLASFYGFKILFAKLPQVKSLSLIFKEGFIFLKSSISTSATFTIHSVVTSFGIFWMLIFIGRFYGSETLGNFNAAYSIMDTAFLVLLASSRNYFFSELGNSESDSERKTVIDRMLSIFLLMNTVFCLFFILFSELIVQILFTKSFKTAGILLSIKSLSFIAATFSWTYNTLFIERKYNLSVTVIDSLSIFFVLIGNFIAVKHWNSPSTCAYVWLGSALFSSVAYTFVAAIKSRGVIVLPVKIFSAIVSLVLCALLLYTKALEASYQKYTYQIFLVLTLALILSKQSILKGELHLMLSQFKRMGRHKSVRT